MKYTIESLAMEIEDAVKWVIAQDEGCVTIKLDDKLAVCVGWSDGYDPSDETAIHAKEGKEWCVNAGIKVWTSDSLGTEFNFFNSPYYRWAEVWDTDQTISPNENYRKLAKWFLDSYDNMRRFKISDGGLIEAEYRYCVVALGYDSNYCAIDSEIEYGEFSSEEEAFKRYNKIVYEGKVIPSYFDDASEEEASYWTVQLQLCEYDEGDMQCVDVIAEEEFSNN